jgi:hypothetical protein
MHEIRWGVRSIRGDAFPTTLWFGDQPHPNQGCIFARVVENDLDRFDSMMKRLRSEGATLVEARRPG